MEEKGGAPDGGMGDRGGNGREEAKRWRKRMGLRGRWGGGVYDGGEATLRGKPRGGRKEAGERRGGGAGWRRGTRYREYGGEGGRNGW